MKQPLLEHDDYSGGYASVRQTKALEDITRKVVWIEYMVTIVAGCALGHLLGMFAACVYVHMQQQGWVAPV
jgi:hypothetical protein